MNKYSLKTVAFAEALGVTLYVSTFSLLVNNIPRWIGVQVSPNPILSIIIFLLTFIISALICGSIVFLYPILLFFDNKKSDALKIVLWTAIWLATFLPAFALFLIIRY
ncbi:hypothetical protein HYT00_02335 [Candidatus Giovannonibacteria bacterium]|nr:hypothetical protein [Candidatus Giovannonibacteria bacterium]